MMQIKESVGKGGKNQPQDVKVVKQLLNKFGQLCGYPKLNETNEFAGTSTQAAIEAFQKALKLKPNKLVEPGDDTFKKLNEKTASIAKELGKDEQAGQDNAAGARQGKVTGPTTGVNQEILDFLLLVSKYGGKDIAIAAPRGGKRSASQQAGAMYDNWPGTATEKRNVPGAVYVSGGAITEATRDQLDDYWNTAHTAASTVDRNKAKAAFLKLGEKTPSQHRRGDAVDLRRNTLTEAMKKVLMKYMKPGYEKGSFHLGYKGKLPSEETVKAELGGNQ
jgi:hypothetical protein